MKVRLRGHTIRCRLTQSEVQQLAAAQIVTQRCQLSASMALSFTLVSVADSIRNAVVVNDLTVTLSVREADVLQWASTDQTGLSFVQENGSEPSLTVNIEKDFACLKPRTGGDDDDCFVHPESAPA
ncbi:MAG: hypothetical protein AB8F65_15265 [Woeseiaceae bacterium]